MEIEFRDKLLQPYYDKNKAETGAYLLDKAAAALEEDLKIRYPINFSMLLTVIYDAKSDRYTGKFYAGNDRDFTVKLSAEVAAFLMANKDRYEGGRRRSIMVYLRLEKGEAVDCLLTIV